MRFTTRPEIQGTFGVTASTHWLATSVGFGILERGGNAFDAAVAMGFTLQIVEPHLNGPAGEFPAIFHSVKTGKTEVLCAQGTTPAGATIEHYKAQGLDLIPDAGLLSTVIPGAFDGWMMMLRDHGTMTVREVMEPAISYARDGHPMLERVAGMIAGLKDFFEAEWPTSYATWCPGGRAPVTSELFKNPDLAATYERLASEADAAGSREAGIEAARKAWSQGFVAEAIDTYLQTAEVMDTAGGRRKGVLTGQDMAGWQASYEAPLTYDYHGYTVCKTGPWGQGPVLLQTLALLKGFDLDSLDQNGPEFVHLAIEAQKLAFADREAFYGDPDFVDIPMETLLSDAHNDARRGLIGRMASHEQRPSRLPGYEHLAAGVIKRIGELSTDAAARDGSEPTMAHLAKKTGDTVHIDVIDRWGNMVSVTPSGGWLKSNPVIPGLGFPLNSRAQMFWLEEGTNQTLYPGRRPRTTLSPSFAHYEGRPTLAFGTPGGDQQDQWQLVLFLRHVHQGMNLQEAIDAPLFHSQGFTSSFYPRGALAGQMMIEKSVGAETIHDLRNRGHIVNEAEPWTVGRLSATRREPNGLLRAAATPRLMQAYAVGR